VSADDEGGGTPSIGVQCEAIEASQASSQIVMTVWAARLRASDARHSGCAARNSRCGKVISPHRFISPLAFQDGDRRSPKKGSEHSLWSECLIKFYRGRPMGESDKSEIKAPEKGVCKSHQAEMRELPN
jgi:hypothetical protein